MRDSILFRQDNEFDERNLLLQLALGLLSASRRFDRVLQRHATEKASTHDTIAAAEDEPVLSFVLGLIAFRARVEWHAGAAALDGSKPTYRERGNGRQGDLGFHEAA